MDAYPLRCAPQFGDWYCSWKATGPTGSLTGIRSQTVACLPCGNWPKCVMSARPSNSASGCCRLTHAAQYPSGGNAMSATVWVFNQFTLFGQQQKPLRKIPYKFSYVFECEDNASARSTRLPARSRRRNTTRSA